MSTKSNYNRKNQWNIWILQRNILDTVANFIIKNENWDKKKCNCPVYFLRAVCTN